MKRTDLERHQRELKRSEKKNKVLDKKVQTQSSTKVIGEYINSLFSLFRYDNEKIFNISNDIKILELLEQMKTEVPDNKRENIIRKAIKKTNIADKESAFNELIELLGQ